MPKLLLSCDEYIYRYEGKYYARSQDWFDFFERYLRVFDSLRLVCRCEEENEQIKGRVPLDADPCIEFVPVPIFHGPIDYAKKYLAVEKALQNVTDGCDAAVLRLPSTVAMRVGNQVMKRGIPYACEVVFDAEDGWRGTKGLSRISWKIIDRRMRKMCAAADGVSCVTERYLQQHYFPTKPGAFTSHYSSLSLDKFFYEKARSFPQHKPVIIAHTARQVEFNGRKGYNQILQSLQILKQRGVQVRVRFAGKDYFGGMDKLKEYARELGVGDMVEFLGYLSREKLDSFLSESDMYVMPTTAEGLPRVIIEAMAKGLPCITTPVSGNPELVGEYFLVNYFDVSTLAERIEELTIDPVLYEKTSKENFERSLKYEASILEARRDEFYRKLREREEAV